MYPTQLVERCLICCLIKSNAFLNSLVLQVERLTEQHNTICDKFVERVEKDRTLSSVLGNFLLEAELAIYARDPIVDGNRDSSGKGDFAGQLAVDKTRQELGIVLSMLQFYCKFVHEVLGKLPARADD